MKFPGALDHPLISGMDSYVRLGGVRRANRLVHWLDRSLGRRPAGAGACKLEEHFVIASKLEYMFWDMAYRQEEWPV